MKLVTEALVRQRLREAADGARVEDAAVQAAILELEAHFEAIIERVQALYGREVELRRLHGIYPKGRVREDHVLGTTILPKPQEALQRDAPEFA